MNLVAERLHPRGEGRSSSQLAVSTLFGEVAVVQVDVLIAARSNCCVSWRQFARNAGQGTLAADPCLDRPEETIAWAIATIVCSFKPVLVLSTRHLNLFQLTDANDQQMFNEFRASLAGRPV